jgi:hypothetical protein
MKTDLIEPPLLYSRAQLARLLSCSVATIQRMERQKLLKPVRLTRSKVGQCYFRREDVLELIESATAAD